MRYAPWLRSVAACLSASGVAACRMSVPPESEISIPAQGDWVDCGVILQAGAEGEWDRYVWGGFALSVLRRGDTYYLYYQGSSGYDEPAGTVTWRSIGVATSPDGFRFTKHSGNPVLSWFPRGNLEEGAVSAAALQDDAGRVVMYYGANTWVGRDRVTADGRIAVSTDGIQLTDGGVALDHAEPALWGGGDEVFPVVAIAAGTRRIVYYIPNGSPQRGLLGVAWGDGTRLTRSAGARSGSRSIEAWGPGGAAVVGPGVFALFLTQRRPEGSRLLTVRLVSANAPERVGPPVATYSWENVSGATVLLDAAAGRWLMYYRTVSNEYGLRVSRLVRTGESEPAVRAEGVPPPAAACGGVQSTAEGG